MLFLLQVVFGNVIQRNMFSEEKRGKTDTSQTSSHTTHLVVVAASVIFFPQEMDSDEQDCWLSYLT